MRVNSLHYEWKIWKDKRKKYRWRVTHKATKLIVGASTQGYVKRSDCVENAKLFGYN